MRYKLVKLEKFCGNKCSVYSVYLYHEDKTLFEKFLEKNKNSHISEIKNIVVRLNTIGHKTGARENFFKLKEGKPGDGVCALYDSPDKKLRLYCIRYGALIIIVGSGSPKAKTIKALQEDDKLKKENYFLRELSQKIMDRIKEREITYSEDAMDFEGNLEFNDDEEE